MDKRRIAKIIGLACTIVIVAFFVGAYFKMPYEFYRTMRWFLLACFGGCAWISRRNKWLCCVFILWALIYNPIGRPINPTRHLWELINVATVAWLGYWLSVFVFSRKDEKAQADLEELQAKWLAYSEEQQNYFRREKKYKDQELKRLSDLVSRYEHVIDVKNKELGKTKEECEQRRKSLESVKSKARDYTQGLEEKITKLEHEIDELKGDISVLKQNLSNLAHVATKAWHALQQWQNEANPYDVGFMFEIYIAQMHEAQDWDVQLVGNQCGPYDLECTNMKNGAKKYVECKYWTKSKTVRRDDVRGLIKFVKHNGLPGRAAAIYATTNIERELDGIEIYPNIRFAHCKFVKGCDKHYYIPTDAEYRALSLRRGKIEYFETTFEAALAGYSRRGSVCGS